jgi:hypothetical protein
MVIVIIRGFIHVYKYWRHIGKASAAKKGMSEVQEGSDCATGDEI